MPSPPDASAPVPCPLVVVGALVLVEAAVCVLLAVWGVVDLVRGVTTAPGVAVFLVVAGLAVAAVLVASVRALRAGRRGGRAPVVTWQLLQAATALTLVGALPSPAVWAAWAALAVAVVVVVGMMTRQVVVHTVPQART